MGSKEASQFFGQQEPTVQISQSEYESLLDDAAWRAAYENAGVDNWSGADFARELYREYRADA